MQEKLNLLDMTTYKFMLQNVKKIPIRGFNYNRYFLLVGLILLDLSAFRVTPRL